MGTEKVIRGSRRSLMRAVTAMSTTSSPKRRPLGQPPGIDPPLPNGSWILLLSTSLPKMLRREKPASSGLLGSVGPLPAKRARGVERSTLIKSGIKMPEISVRSVSMAGG